MDKIEITPQTSVQEIVRNYPHCREVLDRYGLRGCGGPDGPAEPLAFFAAVHQIDLEKVLDELREAAAKSGPAPVYHASPGDILYRRFFKAGIATVLSVGCLWGATNLFKLGQAKTFASLSLLPAIHAHAHAMIFGWVGLFVMGFAYQAFPRFAYTNLMHPRLAYASFYLMAGGIVARMVAQMAANLPLAWLGAVAEWTAIAFFLIVLRATRKQSPLPTMAHERFIQAALFWFVVQAVADPIGFTLISTADSTTSLIRRIAIFYGPLRDIQLAGFAALMIVGVSLRFVPSVYGLGRPEAAPYNPRLLWWLMNGSLVLNVVSFVLLMTTHHLLFALSLELSYLLMLAWAVVAIRDLGLFRHSQQPDRSLKFIRAAYTWLIVAAVMLVLFPLYNHLTGQAFSHAWLGAYRHAYTVGFVSLMILGVSSRVVPILAGAQTKELSSLWWPFILLNVGNALRVSSQILTDHFPATAFPFMGFTGFIEVVGLAVWGIELWRTMNRTRAVQTSFQPSLVTIR